MDALEELKYMTSGALSTAESRSRLLFLFFKDFLTGSALGIVSAKDQRDYPRRYSVKGGYKMAAWAFLVCANIGMFVYVMVFGTQQSTERQRAWVYSYFSYLMMDIFLFSTANVVWTHLFIPSCAHHSVNETKASVVQTIMRIQSDGAGETSPSSTSNFNAAKFFFASHRVASTMASVEEQNTALRFRTVWPKKMFESKGLVPEGSVSVSGPLVGFGGAVSSVHPLAHDIVVSLIITTLLGFVVVAHIPLYRGNPVVAFVPLIVFVLCLGAFLAYLATANNSVEARSVAPVKEPIMPAKEHIEEECTPIQAATGEVAPQQGSVLLGE